MKLLSISNLPLFLNGIELDLKILIVWGFVDFFVGRGEERVVKVASHSPVMGSHAVGESQLHLV
jgi:hypothetical protein